MGKKSTAPAPSLERMKALVEQLQEANETYSQLASAQPAGQALAAPLTAADMAALETRWGRPLPTSYRLFLSVCGGWRNVDLGGMHLLAPHDHAAAPIAERIESFKGWERSEGNEDVERFLFIGAGADSSDILYLDPGSLPAQDNEMALVHGSHDEGEIDRFTDFFAYLEDRLALVRALIAQERPRGRARPAPSEG